MSSRGIEATSACNADKTRGSKSLKSNHRKLTKSDDRRMSQNVAYNLRAALGSCIIAEY